MEGKCRGKQVKKKIQRDRMNLKNFKLRFRNNYKNKIRNFKSIIGIRGFKIQKILKKLILLE